MNLSNLIDKMIQEEPMTVDSVGSIPQSGDEMWSGSSTEGATAGLRKLKKGKKKYTFSNLQGNDIKSTASLILREKL